MEVTSCAAVPDPLNRVDSWPFIWTAACGVSTATPSIGLPELLLMACWFSCATKAAKSMATTVPLDEMFSMLARNWEPTTS